MAFSPDGQSIVAIDYNGNISLRDGHIGTVIWQNTVRAGERYGNGGVALRVVAFSPRGDLIACGGDPGNPRLFEAKSGKYLGMLGE